MINIFNIQVNVMVEHVHHLEIQADNVDEALIEAGYQAYENVMNTKGVSGEVEDNAKAFVTDDPGENWVEVIARRDAFYQETVFGFKDAFDRSEHGGGIAVAVKALSQQRDSESVMTGRRKDDDHDIKWAVVMRLANADQVVIKKFEYESYALALARDLVGYKKVGDVM